MWFAKHTYTHLIEACVTKRNGWIAVKQQFIDRLAFFQSCKCTILPQDRCDIGNRSEKTLMSASQCFVAQFQSVFQDSPEFIHISLWRTCHIYQIDRYNPLIETSVELMSSIRISLTVFYRQERTASHTRIYFSVLHLFHNLGRDVIRHHTFCCTFCCQFCQMPVFGIFCNIIFI